MKKDVVLSILDQVKIYNIARGIFWVGAGVFGFFDNIPCQILHILMLLLAIGCHIALRVYKGEKNDEMSETNMKSAQACTLDAAHLLLLVIAAVISLIPNDALQTLDWNNILPGGLFTIIGFLDVVTGLTFKKLEEEE